jgi:hypothetical protein
MTFIVSALQFRHPLAYPSSKLLELLVVDRTVFVVAWRQLFDMLSLNRADKFAVDLVTATIWL